MRPTDETLERFDEAMRVVDNLSEHLSKNTMTEIARVLSLYIAHYRRFHGEVDGEVALTPDGSKSDDDEDELLLMASEGLEHLADMMLYELERQKQKSDARLH